MSKCCDEVKIRDAEGFAVRLKELMLESKADATTLANRLSLHPSGVYKWLRGVNLPSLTNAMLLADEFNCSLDYLLGLKENEYEYSRRACRESFCDTFNAILRESGMSEYRLVQKTGISRSKISAWRCGKSLPCVENLIAAAEALSVPVDVLAGRS